LKPPRGATFRKQGAWKYAQDLSTFILKPPAVHLKVVIRRTAATDAGARGFEKELHALDPELMELANDPDRNFRRHNAASSKPCGSFTWSRWAIPELPPERWHDTMAVAHEGAPARARCLAITALELPMKKDMDGHRLMLIMCKPDRIGGWSQHNDYNLSRLKNIVLGDVEAQ
jgi:hypothetical protein